MQKLPVRFYDSHTNGEIMSYYTNDVDTLTEFIARGLPMIFRVGVTIISTFIAMCVTSLYLTGVVLVVLFIMMKVTKKVGGNSARYFMEQQKSISKVDGYIEEMINGQKVVKVFSHEDESIEGFKKINDKLYEDMTKANTYSNVLGPMLGNIGNLQFVLLGVVGGVFFIAGDCLIYCYEGTLGGDIDPLWNGVSIVVNQVILLFFVVGIGMIVHGFVILHFVFMAIAWKNTMAFVLPLCLS